VLEGPAGGNPFVEVSLSAEFRKGRRVFVPEGFYDGEGVYKVRFMPDEEGVWRYRTKSNKRELRGVTGEFLCTSARAGNHGPVSVRNRHHFGYADGQAYWPVGTTCYGWALKTAVKKRQTIASLRRSPFNKIRMIVMPFAGSRTRLFPFPGKSREDWDFSRFDPRFFHNYERCLRQLMALGIEADVIFFHPYDKGRYGFDMVPHSVNIRFLRYCIARFGAFRHVWWSIANEFDFLRTRKMSEWDSFGRAIAKHDPYGKLCSIHNGALMYNNQQPWITHASIQNGSAVADFGRARIYRDCFRKPVIYDEVCYEGNLRVRWGNLSGEEMTHRFWQGYIAGTYVGHSESWRKGLKRDSSWLGSGGKLEGKSWRRMGFLRRIMEEGPQEGIGPVDGDDMCVGGIRGRYYVVYFGWEKPGRWKVDLPRGVPDGARCRIDIIDTWDMKVKPVRGVITLKTKGRYHVVGANGEVIRLPRRPFMAIRIRILD